MPARAEIHTAFPRYLTVTVGQKSPDDATRQKIQREIEDAFAVHLRDDNTRLASTVFLVKARRPR
jgi:hypothetical protein